MRAYPAMLPYVHDVGPSHAAFAFFLKRRCSCWLDRQFQHLAYRLRFEHQLPQLRYPVVAFPHHFILSGHVSWH